MEIQWSFAKGIYSHLYYNIPFSFPFVEEFFCPVPILFNNIINNEINSYLQEK